jgi:hypothetical protein
VVAVEQPRQTVLTAAIAYFHLLLLPAAVAVVNFAKMVITVDQAVAMVLQTLDPMRQLAVVLALAVKVTTLEVLLLLVAAIKLIRNLSVAVVAVKAVQVFALPLPEAFLLQVMADQDYQAVTQALPILMPAAVAVVLLLTLVLKPLEQVLTAEEMVVVHALV